jgi:hypothetical protein
MACSGPARRDVRGANARALGSVLNSVREYNGRSGEIRQTFAGCFAMNFVFYLLSSTPGFLQARESSPVNGRGHNPTAVTP